MDYAEGMIFRYCFVVFINSVSKCIQLSQMLVRHHISGS